MLLRCLKSLIIFIIILRILWSSYPWFPYQRIWFQWGFLHNHVKTSMLLLTCNILSTLSVKCFECWTFDVYVVQFSIVFCFIDEFFSDSRFVSVLFGNIVFLPIFIWMLFYPKFSIFYELKKIIHSSCYLVIALYCINRSSACIEGTS